MLYPDTFTVKLSEYNFHCTQTIFVGQIKYKLYIINGSLVVNVSASRYCKYHTGLI